MKEPAFTVRRLCGDFGIEEKGDISITFPPNIEQRVEILWQQENGRRGDTLFNGRVLSLMGTDAGEQLNGGTLAGGFIDYRYLVAQLAEPSLYKILGIRPLAVTGVLQMPQGILFGRRSGNTLQDAGLWELAPAGGLSPVARADEGLIDPRIQLFEELEEEITLSRRAVLASVPKILLIDNESHVHDVVIELSTAVDAEPLMNGFGVEGRGEYSALRCVSIGALADFLGANSVSASTRAICRALDWC